MADIQWKTDDEIVARRMDSNDFEVGDRVPLSINQYVGYAEEGRYISKLEGSSPEPIPKRGFFSRMIKKTPKWREFIFVENREHKIMVRIKRQWKNKDTADLMSILTIQPTSTGTNSILELARATSEHKIYPQTIVDNISLRLNARVGEWVVKQVNLEEVDMSIENNIQHFAEEELNHVGFKVTRCAVIIANNEADRIEERQRLAWHRADELEIEREEDRGEGLHKTGKAVDMLSGAIREVGLSKAFEDIERSGVRIGRRLLEEAEDKDLSEIDQQREERQSEGRIRSMKREAKEQALAEEIKGESQIKTLERAQRLKKKADEIKNSSEDDDE